MLSAACFSDIVDLLAAKAFAPLSQIFKAKAREPLIIFRTCRMQITRTTALIINIITSSVHLSSNLYVKLYPRSYKYLAFFILVAASPAHVESGNIRNIASPLQHASEECSALLFLPPRDSRRPEVPLFTEAVAISKHSSDRSFRVVKKCIAKAFDIACQVGALSTAPMIRLHLEAFLPHFHRLLSQLVVARLLSSQADSLLNAASCMCIA